MNMLLVNALVRYSLVYGDDYKLECPTGSGQQHSLVEIAEDIARRLVNLFIPDKAGHRPRHGNEPRYATNPHWKDLILFSEYFDGDTGRGVGASHQTGSTALAATLIEALYTRREICDRAQWAATRCRFANYFGTRGWSEYLQLLMEERDSGSLLLIGLITALPVHQSSANVPNNSNRIMPLNQRSYNSGGWRRIPEDHALLRVSRAWLCRSYQLPAGPPVRCRAEANHPSRDRQKRTLQPVCSVGRFRGGALVAEGIRDEQRKFIKYNHLVASGCQVSGRRLRM